MSLDEATIARPAGIPEWPKGAGCKPAGSAFGGSNPPPCIGHARSGSASADPDRAKSLKALASTSCLLLTCRHEGYTRRHALLAQSVEHLHGKEGVDGSSPSEGSSKKTIPGNRGFLLSNTATTEHHYRRDGYPARCAAAKPLQIDLLPGTSEHLPKREGIGSRVARRGPPRTAWTNVMWRGLAREVRVGLRRDRFWGRPLPSARLWSVSPVNGRKAPRSH